MIKKAVNKCLFFACIGNMNLPKSNHFSLRVKCSGWVILVFRHHIKFLLWKKHLETKFLFMGKNWKMIPMTGLDPKIVSSLKDVKKPPTTSVHLDISILLLHCLLKLTSICSKCFPTDSTVFFFFAFYRSMKRLHLPYKQNRKIVMLSRKGMLQQLRNKGPAILS